MGKHWTDDVARAWIVCKNCGCTTTTYENTCGDDTAMSAWNANKTHINKENLKKWNDRNEMRRLKKELKTLKGSVVKQGLRPRKERV